VVIGEGEKDEAPMLYCGEWSTTVAVSTRLRSYCCSRQLGVWACPVLHLVSMNVQKLQGAAAAGCFQLQRDMLAPCMHSCPNLL
jgi:hypothetical protein